MQYDDDIAFQRAILANPADTTQKLVYADWLQDRADPRAEFVRMQVAVVESPRAKRDATIFGTISDGQQRLTELGRDLDPVWIAFMSSLAQPFQPLTFRDGKPSHPFTEPIGLRGGIAVFESQYRAAEDWSKGLLADLTFLASVEWDECSYGAASCPMFGFVCGFPFSRPPLTTREVLTAIKAANFRSEHISNLDATQIPYPGYQPGTANDEIHTEFAEQYLFEHDAEGEIESGTHGAIRRYVTGEKLWYALLHVGEQPGAWVTLLAVGQSPHGNRLVGAITSQMCHNLCD
jgi:uncharacterized protein (TIGR02996 family)